MKKWISLGSSALWTLVQIGDLKGLRNKYSGEKVGNQLQRTAWFGVCLTQKGCPIRTSAEFKSGKYFKNSPIEEFPEFPELQKPIADIID